MEIIFESPQMFLLTLVIPVMIILHYYFFEHNRRKAMKFANFSAMKRVTGTTLITKNTSQLVMRVLVFVSLILAASRPVIWYDGQASISDYVIALDASASMVAEDVQPDRLTVAKQASTAFIDRIEGEVNIGLVSFAGTTFIEQTMTDDLTQVKNKLNNIEIQLSGGTDIGAALITATNLLNPVEKSKTIILVTDGSETAGSFVEESIDAAIDYVNEKQVIVHTIGIGTGSGIAGYTGDANLRAAYNKDLLRELSQRTEGQFFEVKNTAEIAAAFRGIEQQSQEAQVSYKASGLMMALGIILLLIEWGLLNTKFRALP